jgi:hypothetical protein
MKQKKSIRLLLCTVAFATLVIFSCSKDKFGGDTSPTLSASDYKMTINYDAESTVTRQAVNQADESKLKEYDKIAAIPFVNRVQVQMGIKADGTSDWVVTKKEPKNPLKTVSNAPADPTPKAVTLKVKDNKLTTYDKSGKLLKTKDLDMNSVTKRYMELLNHDPSQVSLRSSRDIRTIIADAHSQGAIVTTTDSIHYCIKKDNPSQQQYSLTYIDASIGKIIGSSINNSDGRFIYSNNIVFVPNPSNANDYVISRTIERSFSTSPSSGVDIVTEKITQFHSFSRTEN